MTTPHVHTWQRIDVATHDGLHRCADLSCRVLGYGARSNYFRRARLAVKELKCRDCRQPATERIWVGTQTRYFCDVCAAARKRGAA